jgi:hypothetical protein
MDFIFHIIENNGILVKNKRKGFTVSELSNMIKKLPLNKSTRLITVSETENEVSKSIITFGDISLQFNDESSQNSSDDSVSTSSKSSNFESSNMGCNVSSDISKFVSLISIGEPWVEPHPVITHSPYIDRICSQYKSNLLKLINIGKWELFNNHLTNIIHKNKDLATVVEMIQKSFKKLINKNHTKLIKLPSPELLYLGDYSGAINASLIYADLPSDIDTYENGKL